MSQIDYDKLAIMVKAKRDGRGLREIAAEIGDISPSTLSRLENNKVTDMTNSSFLQLCDWLQISPTDLILGNSQESDRLSHPEISTVDSITLQLRADPNLDPKTAAMISEMVQAAYKHIAKQDEEELD